MDSQKKKKNKKRKIEKVNEISVTLKLEEHPRQTVAQYQTFV